ncbi:MAG: DUF6152 family protein [Woeseiaceae bacterium]
MKHLFYLALLLFVSTAAAHHSSSPHFDASKPIQLEGVVTNFKFVNPHAYLYFDVTNADGSVTNWNCEMSAASGLKRNGWTKELFAPGTKVSIDAIEARRDAHGCAFQSGVLEDGTRLARNGTIERAEPVEVVAESAVDAEIPSHSSGLAGNWIPQPRRRAPGAGGMPPRGPRDFKLTAAGEAASATYDSRYDDPAYECSPSSLTRVWGEPGVVNQIEVLDDKVIIRHGFMDTVRTIYLADTEMPADYVPSLTGFSVGHFDGDELVIETSGIPAGVLTPHAGGGNGGYLHSDKLHVSERLSASEDGEKLIRSYSASDAEYFATPYSGTNTYLRSELPMTDYDCVELSGVSKQRPEDE